MLQRTTTIVLVLAFCSAAQSVEEPEWHGEIGFQTRYEDNYFHRDDDNVTSDETFFTLYGEGEAAFEVGPGDLELSAGASGAFARDLDAADHQVYDVGVGYKLGGTRVLTEYTHIENKVFGEEDDSSFFDIDSGEIELRQSFSEDFSGRASVDIGRWDFTPPDNDRDAMQYKFQAMLRWAAFPWLAFRTSGLWAIKRAERSRFDWKGPGVGVAAELKPLEDVNLFVRYRRRWREYDGGRIGDSNFRRDDTIDDVSANVRWHVTDLVGLQLGGSYRNGDSDRRDRNYDASSVFGGVFMELGND